MKAKKIHPEDVSRFWQKVRRTDSCWLFVTGSCTTTYKQFSLGLGRGAEWRAGAMPAHRFSYLLHFGTLPADLVVCHVCDNKACVRPDHLFLGTERENARDFQEKIAAGVKWPREAPAFVITLTDDEASALGYEISAAGIEDAHEWARKLIMEAVDEIQKTRAPTKHEKARALRPANGGAQ